MAKTYENRDNGYLYPNQGKRDDGDCDSYGRIWIGEVEHRIESRLSDAGDQMELEFLKPGMYDHPKGTGSMKLNTATGDNPPKWKGTLKTADGQRIALAGWIKKREGKPPLLSLTLKPIEAKAEAEQPGFPL